MRKLIVLIGPPASGKSTFIRDNHLEAYTVCPDDLRLLYGSPVQTETGGWGIPQNQNKLVWEKAYEILAHRMSNGDLTVFDATNLANDNWKKFKELAHRYRYRIVGIDFRGVSIEELKRRNAERDVYRRVPDAVLEKFHAREATFIPPKGVMIQRPSDFNPTTPLENYDRFTQIHHIGDVQGCATALHNTLERLNVKIADDTIVVDPTQLYIFVGDLCDRGIENDRVIQLCMRLKKEWPDNFIFVEGNHEKHLFDWAAGRDIVSGEFRNNTQPQLDAVGFDMGEVRSFLYRMKECVVYKYREKTVVVTHAGLDWWSDVQADLIPSSQFIRTPQQYDRPIDTNWNDNMPYIYYQVHGHRNPKKLPIENQCSFNLEGEVEFGGHLRSVSLDEHGWHPLEMKNEVFKAQPTTKSEGVLTKDKNLEALRNSPHVRENPLPNNISSFNFTRDAFYGKNWTNASIRARGLFVNTQTEKIVARSFEKFFNEGEFRHTEFGNVSKEVQYPVVAYRKENGYLGIMGYDKSQDMLITASKSTTEGWFANNFRDMLFASHGEEELKGLTADGLYSIVFEVVDPVYDPHIIDYDRRHLVTLAMIVNDWDFKQLSYTALRNSMIRFRCKEMLFIADDAEELRECIERDKDGAGKFTEGIILEDGNGAPFLKYKYPFYNYWKRQRSNVQRMKSGKKIDDQEDDFVKWLRKASEHIGVTLFDRSIIELRNMYLKSS